MKKTILYFMIVFFSFTLTGCDITDSSDKKTDNGPGTGATDNGVYNVTPPSGTVKLIFMHHSCGQNWLSTGNGNLGTALNANNYFVSDTNYGWDAESGDNLGDHTDTSDWPLWFNNTKMPYVYAHYANSCYTNSISDPGGENEIVMFKSCYPLSEVGGSIDDEKAIYNGLLTYSTSRLD